MVGTGALLSAQTTAWWCLAGEEGPGEAAESTLQGWVLGWRLAPSSSAASAAARTPSASALRDTPLPSPGVCKLTKPLTYSPMDPITVLPKPSPLRQVQLHRPAV